MHQLHPLEGLGGAEHGGAHLTICGAGVGCVSLDRAAMVGTVGLVIGVVGCLLALLPLPCASRAPLPCARL